MNCDVSFSLTKDVQCLSTMRWKPILLGHCDIQVFPLAMRGKGKTDLLSDSHSADWWASFAFPNEQEAEHLGLH